MSTATPHRRTPSKATRAAPAVRRSLEGSALLRTYRRLIPARVRRAVVARTSTAARARMKQYIAVVPSLRHLLGRMRAYWLRCLRPGLYGGPDRAVRLVRDVPKAVTVGPDISPLAARNANAAA